MSKRPTKPVRVLAVNPGPHGFGYAVFEHALRLIDWGKTDIRKDNEQMALVKLRDLLRRFTPHVLVLEDCGHPGSRRNRRISLLIGRMRATARALGIETRNIPRALVYRHFAKAHAATKHEIASLLADRFPGLLLRLPARRKPWQTEDSRMSIFDAAALALTYYSKRHKNDRSPA